MPPVPTSKRTSPKTKGATRGKSGCYTCRIRRKKCDEQPDETGSCQTCARLRLECLGFGAKRPEWLRESRNVTEVREKIKNFLALHGMIKGHAGSGPTHPEVELPTLRLAEEGYSDSSESPPTPTLTLPSDNGGPLIAIHDELVWNATYAQPSSFSSALMGADSPYSPQFEFHSLVPSPATQSTFSPLYYPMLEWFGDINMYPDNAEGFPQNPDSIPPEFVDAMVSHYMKNVVYVQYLLVDKAIPAMIFQTVTFHERSREAVKLLASVHYQRCQPHHALRVSGVHDRLESLNSLLDSARLVAEDAMAALHVVSSILFGGGQGSWKKWLNVAYRYVRGLLQEYNSRADEALLNCSDKDAFIIKTTIWFDVLASVTTLEAPYLLQIIRDLFHPAVEYNRRGVPPRYSMLSPMGCENIVVWVLAETSELARWKRDQLSKGSLSVPELVVRADEIERWIPPPSTDVPSGDLQGRCLLASGIFRSASHLYLRSVVSGDHPHVREIAQSVDETVRSIQRITYETGSSIVRSTVFGFFICGALADSEYSRTAVLRQLAPYRNGTGNCGSIQVLLEQLWEERRQSRRGKGVLWRQLLKDTATLLV